MIDSQGAMTPWRVFSWTFAVILLSAYAAMAAPDSTDSLRDNLYGTKFVSAKEGWAVGAFGVIAHTGDGGASWQMQQSRTTEQLFDVDFVDARHGWIVGRSGIILATEDGGSTWSKQNSSTDKHLFAVDFADAETGVAVGDWGAVVVTTDGGKTWETRSVTQDVILNDVQMIDRNLGFSVGELGTVLKTEDGGKTWNTPSESLNKALFGLYFKDAQEGWAVGLDGLVVHTSDGAATWNVQRGSIEVSGLEQVQFSQSLENPSLYGITVLGERGLAVGETGAIFSTSDAGGTWTRLAMSEEVAMAWLRSISVAADGGGGIVGAGGHRVLIVNGEIQHARGGISATTASR